MPPAPPKIETRNWTKIESKNKARFFPKWPPKGTLKISRILSNLQNCGLEHLPRALLAASISERVSKPSPRTSRTCKNHCFASVKPIVFRNPLWSRNGLFWTPFWTLLGPLSLPCPPQWRPKWQKGPFQKTSKKSSNFQTQTDPKMTSKMEVVFYFFGVWNDSGPHSVPDLAQASILVTFGSYFWTNFITFKPVFKWNLNIMYN